MKGSLSKRLPTASEMMSTRGLRLVLLPCDLTLLRCSTSLQHFYMDELLAALRPRGLLDSGEISVPLKWNPEHEEHALSERRSRVNSSCNTSWHAQGYVLGCFVNFRGATTRNSMRSWRSWSVFAATSNEIARKSLRKPIPRADTAAKMLTSTL